MDRKLYDYIVIGAGTAGLVLAHRLTEDAEIQVLVVEAGEDHTEDDRVSTPALFPTLLGSELDWDTVCDPQDGLNGQRIHLPHGKVLGGSSAINGQVLVPPSKINIDTWEKLGNPGWDWKTLGPYFAKMMNLTKPNDPSVCAHYCLDYVTNAGSGGPLQASFPTDVENKLPKIWLETIDNLGWPLTNDPFTGDGIGGYTNAISVDPVTRQRSSSATAYWKPIRDRPNLHLITGATVQRIILQGNDPDVIASGVSYMKDGRVSNAYAHKEVILAAGTLHSPKLLELSGIGGSKLLQKFDIPVVIDNPNVGENLQDHPMTGLSFEVAEGVTTNDALQRQEPDAMKAALEAYASNQSGPLSNGGIISYALLPTVELFESDGLEALNQMAKIHPDKHPLHKAHTQFVHEQLQNRHEASTGYITYPVQGNFGGEGSGKDLMTHHLQPGNFFSIACLLMYPLSRGFVHIQSSNAQEPVRVDPKYLVHPLDLEVQARNVRFIGKIVQTEPLKSLLKEGGLRNRTAPPDLNDLDALKDYLKLVTMSGWHMTSTCAMLPKQMGGVVNPRLVVHGTKNLRIVDASVFPITTRANPQATVYAVAERAADLIKEDHQ